TPPAPLFSCGSDTAGSSSRLASALMESISRSRSSRQRESCACSASSQEANTSRSAGTGAASAASSDSRSVSNCSLSCTGKRSLPPVPPPAPPPPPALPFAAPPPRRFRARHQRGVARVASGARAQRAQLIARRAQAEHGLVQRRHAVAHRELQLQPL